MGGSISGVVSICPFRPWLAVLKTRARSHRLMRGLTIAPEGDERNFSRLYEKAILRFTTLHVRQCDNGYSSKKNYAGFGRGCAI